MATALHFFLGANSGGGFQSLFGQLSGRTDFYDLMILKGGPGTGKSTFMKQIGQDLEAAGEPVEYIHCSGDPEGLDAVLMPGLACGVVDGTAPHLLDTQFPAAVDRIVDLGRFCDLTAAKAAREEIIAWTGRCQAAYCRAFHSLRAAREVERDAMDNAASAFDANRARRRVEGIAGRELRRSGNAGQGRTARRFLGGLTCQGWVWRFDSVDALCPKIYELADRWELAGEPLEQLRRAAVGRGWDVIACMAPENPARMEHLLIPGLGLAFVSTRPDMERDARPYRRIRLDAMTQPEGKARARFSLRLAGELRREAEEALADAKRAHDALEALHNPYVDFDGVRKLAAAETGRLLSWRTRR